MSHLETIDINQPRKMASKAGELFYKAQCMARAVLIVNTAHQAEFDFPSQREDCTSYLLEAMHAQFDQWTKLFNAVSEGDDDE